MPKKKLSTQILRESRKNRKINCTKKYNIFKNSKNVFKVLGIIIVFRNYIISKQSKNK